MPLLEQGISKIPGLTNISNRTVDVPTFTADDFPNGFQIIEYEEGQQRNRDNYNGRDEIPGSRDIILKGPFMPHIPFTFGGEQRVQTKYYPGNPEPTVHIMGGKEDDLIIKGHFRLKDFSRSYVTANNDANLKQTSENQNVRQTAIAYQELIDQMRLRGNVVHLVMGAWSRWGFIKSVKFDLNTIADISYTIEFIITGFSKPSNIKLASGSSDNLSDPNAALITNAAAAISKMSAFPKTMPLGLAANLNAEIGKVAAAIKVVTDFVSGALNDADQLQASLNRAIGLIKTARTAIYQSAFRINQIATSVSSLGSTFVTEWEKTKGTILSVNHMQNMKGTYYDLQGFLASLQAQLDAMRKQIPLQRYIVKNNDTLQAISSRYYATPDHWDAIYSHNNLQTTQLVIGTILEIPRL